MSERAAVTKAKARAYAVADRARKTAILDELVDLTAQDRHQDLEHRSQTLACRSTQHRPALDQRHDDPGPIRRPPRPPSLDHPQLQPPREASNSRRLRTPTLAKTFLRWSCTVYGDTSLTCAEGVRRGHDRRDLGDLLRIHQHARGRPAGRRAAPCNACNDSETPRQGALAIRRRITSLVPTERGRGTER